jgi:hypothetical protein
MTFNRSIGVKELIAIFVLIGAIASGIFGIRSIAGSVSSEQINEHTIITEEKHADRYNEFRMEQSVIQRDVAVTKEQVKQIGKDVDEIKEMIRDSN